MESLYPTRRKGAEAPVRFGKIEMFKAFQPAEGSVGRRIVLGTCLGEVERREIGEALPVQPQVGGSDLVDALDVGVVGSFSLPCSPSRTK